MITQVNETVAEGKIAIVLLLIARIYFMVQRSPTSLGHD